MRVVRCQECEVAISLYCRKCPNCRARNPTYRRRSPVAMFILVLFMALVLLVVKNLKADDGVTRDPDRVAREAGRAP